MRVLLDTNIFVYMSTDPEYLSWDVLSLLKEPDTLLYISAESVRELIVGYRNKGLCSKRWKTVDAMVAMPWWRPSRMNFTFRSSP